MITFLLKETDELQHLNQDLIIDTISETVFEKGHEADLEIQKPFISSLIWGSICFVINKPIQQTSVKCTIEFENGETINIPQEVVYDINRIVGA